MPDNRLEPTTPATSPTGAPSLPTKYVPILVVIVSAAGAGVAFLPEHTVAFKVCAGIVALGAAFGIASPGLRKK